MSHKSIRLLIEDTAKSLGDDIQFTYARTSDFNSLRDKRYPFISLDPLNVNSSFTANNTYNYTKVWSVLMAFYELDNADSDQSQYSLLLDSADILVDRFIAKLNFYSQQSDSIVIQAISQSPFIKATSDYLTGYTLSFQIIVPNDWDYCIDGC